MNSSPTTPTIAAVACRRTAPNAIPMSAQTGTISAAEQPAYPQHSFGVQTVQRLVEQEHRRVAEEGTGDAEALLHPQREPSDAAPRRFGRPDVLEDLVHAGERDAVAAGQGRQVRLGAAPAVDVLGVQERADVAQSARAAREGDPANGDGSAGGGVQVLDAIYQVDRIDRRRTRSKRLRG